MTSMTDVIHSNMEHKHSFFHRVCKESIYTVNVVMYFPKNFYLVEALNQKLNLFLSNGIVKHLIEKYVDMRYWNVKRANKGPQQLKLQHLQGTFNLWMILCCLSMLVLVMEIIVNAFHQMIIKLRRNMFIM